MAKPVKDQYQDFPAGDAEDLLRAGTEPKNFAPERLAVPEIGRTVYVRRLSAAEVDQYAADFRDINDADQRATVLAHALCDDAGNRLYQSDGDIAKLRGWNAKAATRVVRKFQEINGMGDEAEKK